VEGGVLRCHTEGMQRYWLEALHIAIEEAGKAL
jgi:hypothetical protein